MFSEYNYNHDDNYQIEGDKSHTTHRHVILEVSY